jgi:hypothetical protein
MRLPTSVYRGYLPRLSCASARKRCGGVSQSWIGNSARWAIRRVGEASLGQGNPPRDIEHRSLSRTPGPLTESSSEDTFSRGGPMVAEEYCPNRDPACFSDKSALSRHARRRWRGAGKACGARATRAPAGADACEVERRRLAAPFGGAGARPQRSFVLSSRRNWYLPRKASLRPPVTPSSSSSRNSG